MATEAQVVASQLSAQKWIVRLLRVFPGVRIPALWAGGLSLSSRRRVGVLCIPANAPSSTIGHAGSPEALNSSTAIMQNKANFEGTEWRLTPV